MEIQGPFTIAINDNSETGLRELHLGFKPAIQQLSLDERLAAIKNHLSELHKNIEAESDTTSQQGMITITQIIEELLPHLEADEIPLNETIVIEIGPVQTSPFDDLLRGATLS
ncbi:hypothetical protein MNBD_GAMMA09-3224 [hydrothermal vent metagenome]|uniref:Uncharacterized protein n=1 Tax=hydrothermal vent metagenome TaxID=652676 RepID=A0A3B0XWN4_9ZZZZ